MPEKGPSILAQIFIASFQIVIALIGLAGAIGAAYITTGVQFQNELTTAKGNVNELKTQGQKIIENQDGVNQLMADLQQRLDDATAKNAQLEKELVTQKNELQTGLEQLRQLVENSKSDINKTRDNAIEEISKAKSRGADQRVMP